MNTTSVTAAGAVNINGFNTLFANGFSTIEKGGNLIYTYYRDDKTFYREVDRYVGVVKGGG